MIEPKIHKSFKHSKFIGELLASSKQMGRRIGSGEFLIDGRDFVVKLNIWADSYGNHTGDIYLKEENEEFSAKILSNFQHRETTNNQGYAFVMYTVKNVEQFLKDVHGYDYN